MPHPLLLPNQWCITDKIKFVFIHKDTNASHIFKLQLFSARMLINKQISLYTWCFTITKPHRLLRYKYDLENDKILQKRIQTMVHQVLSKNFAALLK